MIVVVFAVVAIDSGRLWYAKRHLQQVADIAAMSAARTIGCAVPSNASLAASAQAAAAANGYTGNLASAPNSVTYGEVKTGNAGVRGFGAAGGGGSRAVKVVATQAVPTSLVAPLLYAGNTVLQAEATAVANQPSAAFTVGSVTAKLNDGVLNSLFTALIGAPVNLTLAGYQGLAQASLSVLDLIHAGLTAGSVDEVLNTDIDLANLLSLTANAINQNNTADAAAQLAGNQLIAAVVPGTMVRLGDILALDTANGEAALDSRVNALDLVTASLMLANKNHAIALNAGVPLLGLKVFLTVIEPPQLAAGFAGQRADGSYCTEAKSAQVRLKIEADPLALLSLTDLALSVEVGYASGGLDDIVVGPGSTEVDIATTAGIARVKLTDKAGTGPAKVKLLGLLTLATASANVDLSVPQNDLVYDVAHPVDQSLPQSQSVDTPLGAALVNALQTPGVIDVRLLGLPLGGGVQALLNILLPVLNPLLTGLIDPLLSALGLQLGVGEVTLLDVQGGGPGLLVI